MRGTELRRVSAASKKVGGAKDRALAEAVPLLLRRRGELVGEVETMRALVNPLVRAWDAMTEGDVAKLPDGTRKAWENLVYAYASTDSWVGTKFDMLEESPAALDARLSGAILITATGFGRAAAYGDHWHTERPEDMDSFFDWDGTSKRRHRKVAPPPLDDRLQVVEQEVATRLAILSEWSAKTWWSRGGLTSKDWAELSNGVGVLVDDIEAWQRRRNHLRQQLETVEALRGEAARPTKTNFGGGWDADLSVYNPGSGARRSGERSRVTLDITRVAPTERVSTVGKDLDRVEDYLKANSRGKDVTTVELTPRAKNRVEHLTRDLS